VYLNLYYSEYHNPWRVDWLLVPAVATQSIFAERLGFYDPAVLVGDNTNKALKVAIRHILLTKVKLYIFL